MTVRTRIAPSPTGPFHIGTARTALFNWLYARQHGGSFVLRIEDTDRERSDIIFEEEILTALEWLNLSPDEGPYRQSERDAPYTQAIEKLLEQNSAFYCFHAPQEREAERQQQQEARQPVRHVCSHKTLSTDERNAHIQHDDSFVIRFNASGQERDITFTDIIRGEITINTREIGDFSIARTANEPLYNLAVVVDDHDMQITHVIRGEDHITNTPRQLLLYEALSWDHPLFAHLPLIVGPDREKLSKRHGATAVLELRDQGYLPEVVVNFLALLGWHPRGDDEKVDRGTVLDEFHLEDVQKGAALFDTQKLRWLNARTIRSLSLEDLEDRIRTHFHRNNIPLQGEPPLIEILHVIRDRMETLHDAIELSRFFYETPEVGFDLLTWKKMDDPQTQIPAMLTTAMNILEDVSEEAWRKDYLEELLLTEAERVGEGDRGMLLWPLRVALSGQRHSPGPHEIAAVIGKEETLKRIRGALNSS